MCFWVLNKKIEYSSNSESLVSTTVVRGFVPSLGSRKKRVMPSRSDLFKVVAVVGAAHVAGMVQHSKKA